MEIMLIQLDLEDVPTYGNGNRNAVRAAIAPTLKCSHMENDSIGKYFRVVMLPRRNTIRFLEFSEFLLILRDAH